MSENVTWATASVCPDCKRMVKHKPQGGSHRWHGCRLRWIARRVAQARSEGFDEGYGFALRNISDPMVYADLTEYGTGWAGLVAQGGVVIDAHPDQSANDDHECVFVEEQEPNGRLILPPCLTCGLTAMDALEQFRNERD